MKTRLLLTLISLAVSPVVPALAQEQNTVEPEVRHQIEAALSKYEKACNEYDTAALVALYTQSAVEVLGPEMAGGAGGVGSGREAIEKRYAAHFASSPGKLSLKLVQMYAIGDEICAISEFSHRFRAGKGYHATIYVREADDWKIRLAYAN
jgi:ketosteroid isomerase-like protein